MDESKSGSSLWVVGLAGLAAIAIAAWLIPGATPEAPEVPAAASAPVTVPAATPEASEVLAAATPPAAIPVPARPAAVPVVEIPVPRIAAGGRLTLDATALPDAGSLTLNLELSDEARGSATQTVRVISVDGRRMDTTASSLPGAGSGVRLEIASGFLSPGRYMIEIDTEDAHPLQIRRYVLEIR